MVGVEQSYLRGLQIYKANVALQQRSRRGVGIDDERDVWETYPTAMIVGGQLLELVERTGARRFVVHTNEDGEGGHNRDGMLVSFVRSGVLLLGQEMMCTRLLTSCLALGV
jgi:HECT-like Ubiquitin-conjugating enzyme (E2)-binding